MKTEDARMRQKARALRSASLALLEGPFSWSLQPQYISVSLLHSTWLNPTPIFMLHRTKLHLMFDLETNPVLPVSPMYKRLSFLLPVSTHQTDLQYSMMYFHQMVLKYSLPDPLLPKPSHTASSKIDHMGAAVGELDGLSFLSVKF